MYNIPSHTQTYTDILQRQGSKSCATVFWTFFILLQASGILNMHNVMQTMCGFIQGGQLIYPITAAMSPLQTSATLTLCSCSPTHCWYRRGLDKINSLTLIIYTSMTISAWRKITYHYREQYSRAYNRFTRSHIRVAALNAKKKCKSLLRAVGRCSVCILPTEYSCFRTSYL